MSFNIFEHDDAVFPVLPTFAIKEEKVLESVPSESQWMAAWRKGNNKGDGYPIGNDNDTPEKAAKRAKKKIVDKSSAGCVLCQSSSGYTVICDSNGPWAVDIDSGVLESAAEVEQEVVASKPESAIFEASDSTASMAMSAVLAWVDGGDYSYSSFDEYVAGIADLDGNEEFSDDELALYNDLFNAAADAFLSLGADAGDVDSFLNGEDDGAGAKIGEIVSSTVDQESATDEEMLDGFSAGVMEADGVMEAAFKKMKVVRGGKVKIVKKRIGKVILSAAQKAGLKKARRKAFSSVARIHRAKSIKIRKQHGM